MAIHTAEVILPPFLAKFVIFTICPLLLGLFHPVRQIWYWMLFLVASVYVGIVHAGELGEMVWMYSHDRVTTSVFFWGRVTPLTIFLSILFSIIAGWLGYEIRIRKKESVPVFEFEQKK